jgi:hypothetical protein
MELDRASSSKKRPMHRRKSFSAVLMSANQTQAKKICRRENFVSGSGRLCPIGIGGGGRAEPGKATTDEPMVASSLMVMRAAPHVGAAAPNARGWMEKSPAPNQLSDRADRD